MGKILHNWKRYWVPYGTTIDLSLDGFLPDPESDFEQYFNKEIRTLDQLQDIPCINLLGEPGLGKTKTLDLYKKGIEEKVEKEGNQILWLNLNSDKLDKDLFDSELFSKWEKGNYKLFVFLDSLDEGQLYIPDLFNLLTNKLGKIKPHLINKFYLRTICRTAIWPKLFDDKFELLWGKDGVKKYELAYLRRKDVVQAVTDRDIDPNKFLMELSDKEAIPLAIKPVSLEFLIEIYINSNQQLPSRKVDLYEQGCKYLASEVSETRKASRKTGELTPDEKLLISGKIASQLILCNKSAISINEEALVSDHCLSFNVLVNEQEHLNGKIINITKSNLLETIDSGLFTSSGYHLIGFAHQTYAEFLAAWYLYKHNIGLKQIKSLIFYKDRKLFPQLYETAGWLAAMIPEVFQMIIDTDPEALLNSDIGAADDTLRFALVARILTLFEQDKLTIQELGYHWKYRKLKHSRLADQLRSYILDKSKHKRARYEAINIAQYCEIKELQNELFGIVIDIEEKSGIKESAVGAFAEICTEESKPKLKAIVFDPLLADEHDTIKGWALYALWPKHISAEELFSIITLPKDRNYIGIYHRFLRYVLPETLRSNDYPAALRWVQRQLSLHHLPHPIHDLLSYIMSNAWNYLDDISIMDEYVNAILTRWALNEKFVDNIALNFILEREEQDEKRRKLLAAIFFKIDANKDVAWKFINFSMPIIFERDIYWLMDYMDGKSEKIQRLSARLVCLVFNWRIPGKYLDEVIEKSKINKYLAEEFSTLLHGVRLDSKEANDRRSMLLAEKEFQRDREMERDKYPSRKQKIESIINNNNLSVREKWELLSYEFMRTSDENLGINYDAIELSLSPVWQDINNDFGNHIIQIAENYLQEGDPETDRWIDTNSYQPLGPEFLGYKAIRLILNLNSDFLHKHHVCLWSKWSPAILAIRSFDKDKDIDLYQMVYKYAPEDFIKYLIRLIDKENNHHGHLSILQYLNDCWDERLALVLLEKVKDKNLKPHCVSSLLEELFIHKVEGIEEYTKSLIISPPSDDERDRQVEIIAVKKLMLHTEDGSWDYLWPILQHNADLARDAFLSFGSPNHYDKETLAVLQRLRENDLTDLFIWLSHQFPSHEDHKHDDGGHITPRENVADFKNYIPQYLSGRGTLAAITALQKLKRTFPNMSRFNILINNAQANYRKSNWIPPKPMELIQLVNNQHKRYVNSADELLEVIIESLEKYQLKLHGESSSVYNLWNDSKDRRKKKYTPKDENHLSDNIKDFLDDDIGIKKGPVVNRELSIHKGSDRTDIHISARVFNDSQGVFEIYKVIIEVKCCWNKELYTAMENQLVNKYLKDNDCKHGLYLVGWYYCDKWDMGKKDKQIDDAKENFSQQAIKLSKDNLKIVSFVLDTRLP